MRLLRHGVLNDFERELLVVADLHCRRLAAVDDLARAALRHQRGLQHLHRQLDIALCARRDILFCPRHDAFHRLHAVRRRHKLDVLVQCVLDDDVRRLALVVPVADPVGDLVADLNAAQDAVALIRRGLLLVRLLRHGVLNGIQRIFRIVSDLHRRGIDDLAGFLCALQHLHGESDNALVARLDVLKRPGHDAARGRPAVACGDERHIRIQLVGDLHRRGHILVVAIEYLVGDLLAHLHRAEHARTLIGRGLALFGDRVLHDLQRESVVVADLHRRGLAAVHDAALSTV